MYLIIEPENELLEEILINCETLLKKKTVSFERRIFGFSFFQTTGFGIVRISTDCPDFVRLSRFPDFLKFPER